MNESIKPPPLPLHFDDFMDEGTKKAVQDYATAAIEADRQARGDGMKPELQAQILTLRKYQAWRTGKDARTMGEVGIKPAAITSALDAVLEIAENHLRGAEPEHTGEDHDQPAA